MEFALYVPPRGARRERRGYGLDDTEDGVSRLKHLRLDPSDRSAPLGGLITLIKKKERGPTGATVSQVLYSQLALSSV